MLSFIYNILILTSKQRIFYKMNKLLLDVSWIGRKGGDQKLIQN